MEQKVVTGLRAVLAAVACIATLNHAATAQVWTDWTAMTTGSPGAATGTMVLPDGPVGVAYTGQLLSGSQIACGTAWLDSSYPAYDGLAIVNPPGTYNSPLPCDMIQINAPGTFAFLFSRPVSNIFMAFVSIGQGGLPVSYDFANAPFTIIDEGLGPWGDGSLASLPGDVLEGREGHGVIRFDGEYSSLQWTVAPGEHWHGFTVGALATSTVPEPMSLLLLGTGLAVVGAATWRRRQRKGEAA